MQSKTKSIAANHYESGVMITILGPTLRHNDKICQITLVNDALLIVYNQPLLCSKVMSALFRSIVSTRQ